MNLPKVLTDLIQAQATFDSVAYADCFTDTATVFDEGHTHTGKKEIEQWIAKANEDYKATMEPVAYEERGAVAILSAKISGSFPGSPIVLQYHFELENGLIQSLRITG